MNKLFLIGNGFDLAHKYPTSYTHFVNWIWDQVHKNPQNIHTSALLTINPDYNLFSTYNTTSNENLKCYNDFLLSTEYYFKTYGINSSNKFIRAEKNFKEIFEFKNSFFYKLSNKYPKADWSDIESFFYENLIKILESGKEYSNEIDTLNSDMEGIKNLFQHYLISEIKYNNDFNKSKFIDLLKYKPKNLKFKSKKYDHQEYFNEFPDTLEEDLVNFDKKLVEADSLQKWSNESDIPNTLLLDFNYTNTIKKYLNVINLKDYEFGNIKHIKIHGELKSEYNPINLGFGDEMDSKYKLLENKNDNRYLKYIKSFMYSNNSYYREFLNWINTNNFQVYILGHSCGLSDRIMLNTIFEHTNCKSIKVYYYMSESNENDFMNKVQNISRHFNKKKQMRDKIVDFSLCEPLKI